MNFNSSRYLFDLVRDNENLSAPRFDMISFRNGIESFKDHYMKNLRDKRGKSLVKETHYFYVNVPLCYC